MALLKEERKTKKGWVALLILLFVILIPVGIFRSLFGPAGNNKYTLEVKKGMSLAAIAKDLQEQGIIRNATVLRYIMRQSGTANKVQEGLYDLNGQMSASQIAEALAATPRFETFDVTIPEGRRIKDLPEIFEKAGLDGSTLADFKSALRNSELVPYIKERQQTVEGFVFPATYEFRVDQGGEEIVTTMINRMRREFADEHVASAKALGLKVYDWVTLASMVQAEAANNAEMPIIAGVFLNRLRDKMTLGSDPTVAYGLNKDLPELNRYEGDFKKDHPYNTYTRQGLPVGPINNPGQAALLSVLTPERKLSDGRDALYFLHAGGKIYVNHTYQEHQRDNDRYR